MEVSPLFCGCSSGEDVEWLALCPYSRKLPSESIYTVDCLPFVGMYHYHHHQGSCVCFCLRSDLYAGWNCPVPMHRSGFTILISC
jgi:hypothetical protein